MKLKVRIGNYTNLIQNLHDLMTFSGLIIDVILRRSSSFPVLIRSINSPQIYNNETKRDKITIVINDKITIVINERRSQTQSSNKRKVQNYYTGDINGLCRNK